MLEILFRSIITARLFWSILALFSTVLVWGPLHIYLSNIREFADIRIWWLFAGTAVVLISILFYRVLLVFYEKQDKEISITFLVLTMLIWFRFYFLNDISAALDGQTSLTNKGLQTYIKIILLVGIGLVSIIGFSKKSSFIRPTAIGIIAVQLSSICLLSYEKRQDWQDEVFLADRLSWETFSNKGNIIYIVLDTFRSDVFAELAMDDSFSEELDGFIYYPNALSGYTTTDPNMSLLLTGKYYRNEIPMLHFRKKNEDKSLPAVMQNYGIKTDIFTILPDRKQLYGLHWDNYVPTKYFYRWHDIAVLYNVFIVKIAAMPLECIKILFDDLNLKLFFENQLNDREFMNIQIKLDAGTKRFKFVHLLGVHPPLNMNEDGEMEFLGKDRGAFLRRGHKSFADIIKLIKQLKEKGIYDDTMIVITADHGSRFIPQGKVNFPILNNDDQKNQNIVNEAVPLVLVKPSRSNGKLRFNKSPITIGDLPKTIADAAGVENDYLGYNILDSDTIPIGRLRTFYSYKVLWDEKSWQRGYLPTLLEYKIEGFSWDENAWRRGNETLEEPLHMW